MLKHVLVSLYFSFYKEDEIEAKKKVLDSISKQIDFLGDGVNIESKYKLAEHLNKNLSLIYKKWEEND